jgi:hypothetical protein
MDVFNETYDEGPVVPEYGSYAYYEGFKLSDNPYEYESRDWWMWKFQFVTAYLEAKYIPEELQ